MDDVSHTPIATRPGFFRRWKARLSPRAIRESGQALVEFAMIAPFLFLLLFVLVDFGRAFYTWLLVTNAAREGARVAATQKDVNTVTNRINDSISGLDSSDLSITLTNVQGPRGQAVEVDLEYDFQFVSPIGEMLSFIGGSSISDPTISSHASMRLE